MTADAAGVVVRSLPGPFALRLCVRTGDGYCWAERPAAPSPAYLGRQALDVLRSRLPAAGPAAATVPALTADGLAVWPAVPTPALLADRLVGSGPDGELPPGVLAALSDFLARVHATPVDGALAGLPHRHLGPAWRSADPAAAAEVARQRRALPLDAAPLVASLAAAADGGGGASTLVHGRFSAALCVPTGRPVVLGWREAGLGDPWADVGHLLGELAEAAALAGPRRDAVALAAAAFLDRYGTGRGRGLSDGERRALAGRTAARVVEHLAVRRFASGDDWGAGELLRGVEAELPALLGTQPVGRPS
ncbi:MAG TPA: phosphotransferase [Frankiaceae bacterium]|nr:phosphotransferase [Frankiaceae bacterium]